MKTIEEIFEEYKKDCPSNVLDICKTTALPECHFKTCPFVYWIQKLIPTTN